MIFNLVVYEDKSWILKRFSIEIGEVLQRLGHNVLNSNKPDNSSDVNIHFDHSMIDIGLIKSYSNSIHLIMVTHIDKIQHLKKIIFLSEFTHIGFFTMSEWTFKKIVHFLNNKNIISIIPPFNKNNYFEKKEYFTFGIFSNYYSDNRKNDYLIENIYNICSDYKCLNYFSLLVYGQDWEKSRLDEFKSKGLNYYVDNSPFKYENYIDYLKNIDYYLYTGHDEGSMSFLDAVYFRKRIIATNQGFHNDLLDYIEFPFSDELDFNNTISAIFKKEILYFEFLYNLNWFNYTTDIIKLIEIVKKTLTPKKNNLVKSLKFSIFSGYAIKDLSGVKKFSNK